MIVYLALINFALLATEPPKVVQAFVDEETCLVVAAKVNNEHSKELFANASAFACLKVVMPSV